MAESQRPLLAWLEREVRRCAPLALRDFRSASLKVDRKADQSPVTAADRAVEERLRRAIARACPGEAIIGEEFGRSGRDAETFWTIDPIDGTRAFSRGLPTWCIMVGRIERGRPALGLCAFPALGVTMAVAPGVAAFERSHGRVTRFPRPRAVRSLADAVVFHGGMRWWPPARRTALIRVADASYLERAFGDCYGYLWALRGYADAVLDYGVKIWDMVPLAAFAAATGRVMTDFRGRPCWTGPETLFASPAVGRQLLRLLRP